MSGALPPVLHLPMFLNRKLYGNLICDPKFQIIASEYITSNFMFAPCINSIKAIFINQTDAHIYKITGMLKQLKFPQLLRHVSVHSGTINRELFRA